MLKPTVYVETSVISYLASRPSRNVTVAAHQKSTREWWRKSGLLFEVYASDFVVKESQRGDPRMASVRMRFLSTLRLLASTPEALKLAQDLVLSGILPQKAADDAVHIAIASAHGMDYLVTWNCKHIANAMLRTKVFAMCRLRGFEAPQICTPDELFGGA